MTNSANELLKLLRVIFLSESGCTLCLLMEVDAYSDKNQIIILSHPEGGYFKITTDVKY